jgi:hypothetical protein
MVTPSKTICQNQHRKINAKSTSQFNSVSEKRIQIAKPSIPSQIRNQIAKQIANLIVGYILIGE